MAAEPGEDPWHSRSVEEQLEDLREENLDNVLLPEETSQVALATTVENAIRKSISGFVADLAKGIAVKASGLDLEEFPMSTFTRTYVMQLDLSSNKLDVAQANVLGGGCCWLRDLSLANNSLDEFPSLSGCPNLMRLDLSDNDFETLDGFEAENFPKLRDLDLSGCSLTSLEDDGGSCPLVGLTALETLHLGANDLEEAEDLAPLEDLASVRELFLEDNPCAEVHSCKAQVLRYMPGLRKLDNQGLKGSVASGSSKSHIKSENIDTILEFNKDSSSCSCLEGNACVRQELCTNWKQRYEVAKEVRRRMGLVKDDA